LFRFVFCLSVWLACAGLQAQEKISIDSGSVQNLEEVKIQAYGANTAAFIVPASIAVLSKRDLNRHSTYSLLPSFNSVSGVRLEERSPGSYRLSIRGSLLRSPFGVRNVKVYLDDFILTDAGGNSYLNLLDVASLGGAEIIKGPAGSIYGAGTGGALLLKSAGVDSRDSAGWKINIGTGSYSTIQESVQYQARTPGMKLGVTQSHFQSSGYRDHSGIRKDLIQLRAQLQSSALLQTDLLVLYSDLNYKTPGGLTLAQLSVNPRQSRPATPVLPSARDQQNLFGWH
jgi:iron complex outermembrane receptor protein